MEVVSKVWFVINLQKLNINFFQYLYVWSPVDSSSSSSDYERRRILDEETDEELEEKYANIEVNFDESETEEEEEYIPKLARVSTQEIEEYHSAKNKTEEIVIDDNDPSAEDDYDEGSLINQDCLRDDDDEDFPDEFMIYETRNCEDDDDIPVSRGKSFIQDDIYDQPGEFKLKIFDNYSCLEDVDLDLDDPAVRAAATKIQSAFKGFRVRKHIQRQGYKSA